MSTSFGHDFAHALPARDTADEYRQIERLYGPRNKSWEYVRQSLSMQGPRSFDVITIRMVPRDANSDPITRDVYFDITAFAGVWPDHAAGRILPGAEMNLKDITGAGQAASNYLCDGTPGNPSSYHCWSTDPKPIGPILFFVGLAGLVAYGLGRMATYRSNPCGCQH